MVEQTDEQLRAAYERRQSRPPRTLGMSPQQSALLYNLLCDNARGWNAPLRDQLRLLVTPTEAFEAKSDMKEGKV